MISALGWKWSLLERLALMMNADYSLDAYGRMLNDRGRMDAYRRALMESIRPGDVVLDLGAGIGGMSLLALECGASQVEAIEPNPVILLAQQMAKENRMEDRINFHPIRVQESNLARKIDVIVADLHAALPLAHDGLTAMYDARDRLLLPGGRIIPQKDTIWAAPVGADYWKKEILGRFEKNQFGWKVGSIVQSLRNRLFAMPATLPPPRLFAEHKSWWEIDYYTETETNHESSMAWVIEEEGQADGIALWFDCELTDEVRFSNLPGVARLIYGWVFLPWSESLDLKGGDKISLRLRARLLGGDYIWVWETVYFSVTEGRSRSFSQSTFVADHRQVDLHQ